MESTFTHKKRCPKTTKKVKVVAMAAAVVATDKETLEVSFLSFFTQVELKKVFLIAKSI